MQNASSSLFMWLCLPLAMVLVLIRLGLRVFRRKNFSRGDLFCLAAGLFTLGRLVGNEFLLRYGSTRVLKPAQREKLLDPAYKAEYDQVVMGSKLILFTRTCLMFALWSCKLAVADLIARLIVSMPWETKVMRFIWIGLSVAFIPALIPVFAECHPFHKYWQINPYPGKCVIGNAWLVTYECTNMLTDLMLMCIPLTVIFSVRINVTQRLRLLVLFSIGLFLVAISVVRIKQGYGASTQQAQTIWASLELLLAVVVAVTPTIYGLIKNTEGTESAERLSAERRSISRVHSTYARNSLAAQPLKFDNNSLQGWNELSKMPEKDDVEVQKREHL